MLMDRESSQVEQGFTPQEHRIALLLVWRKSDKEICSELSISLNTTRTWLKRIYGKYDIKDNSKRKRLVAAESYSKYMAKVFIGIK